MAARPAQNLSSSTSTSSSNVKVVVRVRPPNAKELSCGKTNIIKVIDKYMLTFDPKDDEFTISNPSKPRISVLEKRMRDLHFAFDCVFDDQTSNKEVFEHTTKDVLDSTFDGYNCSVFAYGATSAGKTHTMLGSPQEPGVIFLTMMELYRKLKERTNEYDIDISVSYLEIYNETCKDLLLPTGPLAVREDPDKGVCVNGLSLHKPRSAEELLEMLHFGNQNRSQHPTDANKQSSRSHAVFQVFVKQSPKVSGLTSSFKVSKISLIDLAGSERATVTTNCGDRLREGANINKSLLALGNCINALAENKSNYHIPYRNSKLTRLLKDSLGGNCKTIMIAAVSPSSLSYEDTYNTLKYANRAKNIKSSLSVNTVNVDYHVSQYAKIVEDLKKQVSNLQVKLDQSESGTRSHVNHQHQDTDKNVKVLQRFEDELMSIYKEKFLFKQDLIHCEANERKIKLKLTMKEKDYNLRDRLYILDFINSDDHQLSMEKHRQQTEQKLSQIKEQKLRLQASLDENRSRMNRLQNDIDQWANQNDADMRTRVNLMYEAKQNAMDNFYLQKQAKYWEKCFKMQTMEIEKQDKITMKFLDIIKEQKNTIESYKLQDGNAAIQAHDKLESTIEDLTILFEGGQKISWADQSSVDLNVTLNASAFMTNFSSCTPFKTPSRKPNLLRQMVFESRQKTIPEEQDTISTQRNTAFNTGPVRSKLIFTEKENQVEKDSDKALNETRVIFNDTVNSIGETNHDVTLSNNESKVLSRNTVQSQNEIAVVASTTLDETKIITSNLSQTNLNETRVISRELAYHSPDKSNAKRRRTFVVAPSPTNLNATFSLSKRAKQDFPYETEMEIEVPMTPPLSDKFKSSIPVRTPLKSFNERTITKPTTVSRPRMRSYTDGNHTFVIPTFNENVWKVNDDSALNQTFKIDKASSGVTGYTKTSTITNLKRKKFNLGPPSRSYTSVDLFHKENHRPASSTLMHKSRAMKTTQSFNNPFKRSNIPQTERARFKF